MWLLLALLCLGTLIAATHGNILRLMMRCWFWKIPCNNACGCRCHMSDNVWAEAYFCCNAGMPTLACTEPLFELSNERNEPSWRLGFEVLLKSLRFSPCGPLSAAPNKRGFVRSGTGALGEACWTGLSPLDSRRAQSCLYPARFTSLFTLSDTDTQRLHTGTRGQTPT